MKLMKLMVFALMVVCLSVALCMGAAGCDEDDDDDSSGGSSSSDDNKCTGSCAYCEDKLGMWCTGTTEDSTGDTWCWYCNDGQTCNAELGICQ